MGAKQMPRLTATAIDVMIAIGSMVTALVVAVPTIGADVGGQQGRLSFHERTARGKLSACELVFTTVGTDSHYRVPPAQVMLSGSVFSFLRDDGLFIESFKVCGFDLDDATQQLKKFKVDYAYPVVKGKPFADMENYNQVIDDCSVSIYFSETKMVSQLDLDFSSMKIAYSRHNGDQDVKVAFVPKNLLEVVDLQAAHASCVVKLLSEFNEVN